MRQQSVFFSSIFEIIVAPRPLRSCRINKTKPHIDNLALSYFLFDFELQFINTGLLSCFIRYGSMNFLVTIVEKRSYDNGVTLYMFVLLQMSYVFSPFFGLQNKQYRHKLGKRIVLLQLCNVKTISFKKVIVCHFNYLAKDVFSIIFFVFSF